MRLRDLGLFLLIFSLTIFASVNLLEEPPPFQKEYVFEAVKVSRYGVIVLEVPARELKISVVPEGSVRLKIESLGSNSEFNEILDNEYSDDVYMKYSLKRPTYIRILTYLDPGEKVLIIILIEGVRNDLIELSIALMTVGIAMYILLTLISMRYRLDWI